jgi:REP element-mobilizing transposase RayT
MWYRRKSIRLKKFDYANNGLYFITICVQNREYLFGEIKNNKIHLNEMGKIVEKHWHKIPKHFPFVVLDKYIIMPNHIHGIIRIVGAPLVGAKKRAPTRGAPTNTNITKKQTELGYVIGAFKSFVVNEYIRNVKLGKFPPFVKSIFQRNFYEHIIQNDDDLNRIREYIENNPKTDATKTKK